MRRATRQGLAVVVALLLQIPAWRAITTDASALVVAGLAIVGVGLAGVVLRALRATDAVVMIVQTLIVAGGAVGLWQVLAPRQSPSGLVNGAIEHLQRSVAPVEAHSGLTVLIFVLVGLVALLADALVVSLRRPAWVLLPLLVIVLIPAIGPRDRSLPFASVALLGIGLVLVMATARRPAFAPGAAGAGQRAGGVLALAATTALALLVTGVVTPLIHVPPSLRGDSGTPIRMSDPSLDLRRNLTQPRDVTALTYTTDRPGGAYLRMATLPAFGAQGWHLANSDVRVGSLPRPPGLTEEAPTRHTAVRIDRLQSEYLPLPYAPRAVRGLDDRWGYLPDSLVMLALGIPNRGSAASWGLTYDVESVDVQPSAAQLAAAADGGRPAEGDLVSQVPADLPRSVVRLTDRVTRNARTPGERAQAILAYLRQPEFTYSLEPAPGSGYRTIERFLLEDKEGYCEQYAASMAIMARIAGIPSRVAVGFTPGRQTGDGWRVSMRDMHTWPELYFAGWGWVAFEPTPSSGLNSPTPTATPTASPTASPTPTAEPTSEPTGEPTAEATPAPGQAGDEGAGPGGWPWWIALVVLAAAVVVAGPASVRAWVRRRRLAAGRDPAVEALDAWDEVRDTFLDHRHAWPPGSPRYAATVASGELPESARPALFRVAMDAEAALFAAPGTLEGVRAAGASGPASGPADGAAGAGEGERDAGEGERGVGGGVREGYAGDVSAVASGLEDGTSSLDRTRARLWPASLWRRA